MVFGIGEYPQEYNPRVHGAYNPATYYGKADTALKDVKLGEIPSWFSRRSYHPLSIGRGITRAYWTFQNKWLQCKRPSLAGYLQFFGVICTISYMQYYEHFKHHRCAKYH